MTETTRHLTDVFLHHAILARLASGSAYPEALAAHLNIDLARTRATLAGMVATGRVVQVGILYEIRRRAA